MGIPPLAIYPLFRAQPHMSSTNATAVVTSSPSINSINWCNGMAAFLKDNDPALPPETLKARLKQRAKLARRKARAVTGEAPLIGGRPTQGDSPKPATLQRRKRTAAALALIHSTDAGLPDFATSFEAATTLECTGVTTYDWMAAEPAAAAEQDFEHAAAEAAAEPTIEAAAAVAAAAETEAAMEQVAACVVGERAELRAVVEAMVATVATAEAERRRKAQAWARQIAPDRGYVDEARSRSNARDQHTCFVCLDTDIPTDSYMPCCRNHVHKACIQTWHAMGQDKTGKHELKAPRIGGGWKPVVMERLHKCPVCNSHLLSARVPRI